MEESVASKANNTRARVDTKCAVVVFCKEKSAENDDEFPLFLVTEKTRDERREMKERD